jgi:phage-related minor tail protein
MTTEIDDLSIRVSADTSGAQAALRTLADDAQSFAGAITGAFRGAIIGGRDFDSVLRNLALRISSIALSSALRPISTGIGNALSSFLGGFQDGGIVGGGRVRPFADGGVIAAPTFFPVGNGVGLAGEAGVEAILPLARGSDGKLGVRSGAASPVVVNFNVTTPDADSFRKSEAQVTAMLARAVGRGRRGL